MLAPTSNTTTPGSSSSDALIHSRSISSSRAPQDANYHIDDDSRASTTVAASPQYITEGYAVPSTYTTVSPYRTSSTVRNPHVQPSKESPSFRHHQAHSPALSSSYIPPPSSTPSQLNAYLVPDGTYGDKTVYFSHDGAYQHQQQYQQQQYQQNMYQDPYQQTYQQQPYPEPIVHSYPEPELVDTVASLTEKPKPSSTGSVTKPTKNDRRKKFIWIGAIIILIIIGAIVGVVVSMKNKDSDKGGNSSNNSTSGKGSSRTSTTPTPTATGSIPSVPVTVSSTPVTVSFAPVTVPTPTSGGSGSVVTPKPIGPLPEQGQCPTFFCDDWYWDCRDNVCAKDGDYKACTGKCNGDFFCETDCRRSNPCQKECSDTWSSCRTHCR
ncbi:MAG: hypothetical protein JOS17DRAFT_846135 [Linnemannia elongata]|nr:MAG: hypothetical protein JOS17DRAFT_846135 [Linnemannia elongata]